MFEYVTWRIVPELGLESREGSDRSAKTLPAGAAAGGAPGLSQGKLSLMGHRAILELYWDNGKENGNMETTIF